MSTIYYLQHKYNKSIMPIGQSSDINNKFVFYATDGFRLIKNLIEQNKKSILESYVVRSDMNKNSISIEKFLEILEKYKIILDK